MGFLFIILIGDVIFINDLRCSEFLINEESLCYSVKWDNKIWNNFSNILDINFKNGVCKDIIILLVGSYVVVRIWVINLGVWLLYCYMICYLFEGMVVMFNELFEYVVNLLLDIFICKSFYNKEKYLL